VIKGITKEGIVIQARAASKSSWEPFVLYSVYHGELELELIQTQIAQKPMLAEFLTKRSFMDAAIELASTKLLGSGLSYQNKGR
jgi:hypothetical protein